jgi:hypothetical protein
VAFVTFWKGIMAPFMICFFRYSLFFGFIMWTCYSYRRWLQKVSHNYEHVITKQIISAIEISIWCLAYLHKLSSASCPCDKASVLWRIAYCSCAMMHLRCVFCHESSSMGISCCVLNGYHLPTNECASRPLFYVNT